MNILERVHRKIILEKKEDPKQNKDIFLGDSL